MKLSRIIVILISMMMLFIVALPTQAATFNVGTVAELITAINTANTNAQDDTINLTASITLTTVNNTTTGPNGLPVILDDGGSTVTINGNGFTLSRDGAALEFRLIHSQGALIVNDLTLTNGRVFNFNGGGIYNEEGTLEVNNSTFTNNFAIAGGGIYSSQNPGRDVTITDSEFTNNESRNAEGTINVRIGRATITRTIFRQNTALRGGGAYFENTNPTIIDSTFDDNSVRNEGGGIYVASPTFGVNRVEGTTISNNTASEGGGIWDEFSRFVITNSTLSGNSATAGDGGAFFNTDTAGGGNDQLFNVTITGNTASGNGGAIFSDFASATVEVYNSIISDNQDIVGNACAVGTLFGGGFIVLDNNNIIGSNGNDGGCTVGASDTLLTGATSTVINTTLANNGGDTLTHALAVGSIALDAANITNCPTTDQTGVARGFDADGLLNTPAVGDCDIGAVEFSLDAGFASDPIPTSTIDLGTTVVGTEITSILEISETASGRLNVMLASITGANAGDFSVIGLDTSIANGDDPQDV
ncbi:MAG: choice-of-anchor Q domain-containing protein, partial [Chloroflexota bacterium]